MATFADNILLRTSSRPYAPGTTIYYDFLTTGTNVSLGDTLQATSITAFGIDEVAATRAILAQIQGMVNLNFAPATADHAADIHFGYAPILSRGPIVEAAGGVYYDHCPRQ